MSEASWLRERAAAMREAMDSSDMADAIDLVLDRLEELEQDNVKIAALFEEYKRVANKGLGEYRVRAQGAEARLAELLEAVAKAVPTYNRLTFEPVFRQVDRHGHMSRLFERPAPASTKRDSK